MLKLTAALALLLGAQTANAQTWTDFEGAFPLFPCQDGWAACLVDGDALNPDLQDEPSGLPSVADLRIGWFDLDATSAFSPFTGLSEYTGELEGAAVADAGGAEDAIEADAVPDDYVPSEESVAAQEAADEAAAAEATAAAETRAAEEAAAEQREAAAAAAAEMAAQERKQREAEAAAAAAASDSERVRLEAEAAAAAAAAAEAEAARKAAEAEAVRKEEERQAKLKAEEAARQKAEAQRVAAAAAAAAEAERLAAAKAAEEERKKKEAEAAAAASAATADANVDGGDAPVVAADCDLGNLVKLEPSAMLGKMSKAQTVACEETLASASKMTDKGKISRLLMVNAFSKNDKVTWEALVKRHLDEIDQSDPDLCYKYALHLSRKGVGRASGVIRWSDVALENRTVWTGDTYTSRVYSLYKLRAAASQKLWGNAENKHKEGPTDETKAKVDKYRAMTKVMAREWYEYAKVAEKDTTKALQLCMSAAGTKDYCEAG
jgi:chemotaxis protein histidine kinase CheA